MKIANNKICSRLLMAAGTLLLLLYPLRHVNVGVDMWDGGYNAANFTYFGLEHMDSMWFFSTWLANLWGSLLTHLPFGETLLGLNVYTGLTVGGLAVCAWLFAVKKCKMNPAVALVGEIMALGLCWLPYTVVYNYLTFVLLFAASAVLYLGLTREKNIFLVIAGALLGLNVAVRFSNLTQTALIAAVWLYGWMKREKFADIVKKTMLCAAGYVGAFGAFLVLTMVLYGPTAYFDGVMRLFDMTDSAVDYAPLYMVKTLFSTYYQGTYWLKRIVLALAAGVVIMLVYPGRFLKTKRVLAAGVAIALGIWLVKLGFCYGGYGEYRSIIEGGVTVLTLFILYSVYFLLREDKSPQQKLVPVISLVTVLITSLGSNNAVHASINNLFLVLPWFLGSVWEFMREKRVELYLPFQGVLAVVLCLFLYQSLQFGDKFIYEEARGGYHLTEAVEEVPRLKGMKTTAEKARALEELYTYLQESETEDGECILWGQIPMVAYSMELAPAMNVWSDLTSYKAEYMQEELEQLAQKISAGAERPLVIRRTGSTAEPDTDTQLALKQKLLLEFMEEQGYELSWESEMFEVFH